MSTGSPARQLAVLAALGVATCFCIATFVMRVSRTGELTHAWLIWNLFLAWLPMLSAVIAYNLAQTRIWLVWIFVLPCMGFWLLFFPNAPYLVTDLMHIQPIAPVPLWYDLIMIATGVWIGFLLGVISLLFMQMLITQRLGHIAGWLFVLGSISLGSFGIYLGRFLRWNSWDILSNPTQLLIDIGSRVQAPFDHPQTLGFSLLFATFFLTIYLVIVAVTYLPGTSRHTPP
ncbi:MAG: DUF1361 domain-containing protein [Chloroflexi bacterium AL-W]|nr:DUF1361 domain-containing protein [Chloroflexi bacterium AL-N1]NOK65239.1 DUF1361 domain-containing protein [Chloroflexi bacterium AL-N10]NOK72496.1 DUF1361 domain-containing protein [Chloroflexi bacterium AL-N5]NOK79418.1 DUF1361 domain-containing protein [Chloroflexi bacterium AL-W]NOK87334.1 DUF1361 domain-containing protein [Chloroflexi bacterium AL-N15]